MDVEMRNLVPAVQALSEAAFGRPSPFHLSGCAACGAPTFQYPCPSCREWCDHSESPEHSARVREACARSGVGSRESFVRRVGAAGGLGPWYFAEFRRTVGYSSGGAFAATVDAVTARSATVGWPDAGAVWDAIASGARFPAEGFWGAALADFERRAVAEFGEAGVARLKASREPGPWHAWPENCHEGRELVRRFAEERLDAMGLASEPPAAIGP
jgi:hypothetical protein